jgi:hypothetical protein
MVKMAVYEVVLVIAVRNRLMPTSGAVLVPLGMAPAFVVGCLGRRGVLGIDCNYMLVNMICVGMVQVALMKIVSMSFVLNSGVSAGRTMLMSMFFVDATGFRHNVSLCSPFMGITFLIWRMRCRNEPLHDLLRTGRACLFQLE